MDKKNTMLLTVIAVATLLVAVVGATFAYFSVSVANNSSSSSVGATTSAAPGTVLLTGVDNSAKLNLGAAQMLNTAAAKGTYYAVAHGTEGGFQKDGTAPELNVFSIQTSNSETDPGNEGNVKTKHKCTFTLTLTATGLPANNTVETIDATHPANGLVDADGEVVITVPTTNATWTNFATETVKLTALKTAAKTYTDVTVTIEGNATVTPTFHASVTNTDAPQNYLGNMNAEITFGVSDFRCETVD